MKIFIFLFLIPSLLLADTQTLGFYDFSRYLVSKFNELKNNPPMAFYSNAELVNRYGQQNPSFNPHANYASKSYYGSRGFSYNQIAQTPAGDPRNYMVNQTMMMLGTLATSLATTAGTQEAPQSAADLQAQASQLSAVAAELAQSDPNNSSTLQTTVTIMKNEATAIQGYMATQDVNDMAQHLKLMLLPLINHLSTKRFFRHGQYCCWNSCVKGWTFVDMGLAQVLLS